MDTVECESETDSPTWLGLSQTQNVVGTTRNLAIPPGVVQGMAGRKRQDREGWINKHPDVLWMEANPTYTHYQPSGEQPLHIQLWFREEARPAVQQLIKDLEAM